MWSASSPCPVISWKRTPPKPPPTTTGIEPAGAGPASSRVSALPAASLGDLVRSSSKQLEAAVRRPASRRRSPPVAAPGDRLGADPDPGAVVAAEEPRRSWRPRPGAGPRRRRPELGDLGAGGAAALVELAQQLRLALGGNLFGAAARSAAGPAPPPAAGAARRGRRAAPPPPRRRRARGRPGRARRRGRSRWCRRSTPGRRPPPRRRTGPTRSATRRSPSSGRRGVRRRPRRTRRRGERAGERPARQPPDRSARLQARAHRFGSLLPGDLDQPAGGDEELAPGDGVGGVVAARPPA